MTPLTQHQHLQPLIKSLKIESVFALGLGLTFIQTKHGLSYFFYTLFSVRKSDIQSYEAVFSRHDLWVFHHGLLSAISGLLLIGLLFRWIRLYFKLNRFKKLKKKNAITA